MATYRMLFMAATMAVAVASFGAVQAVHAAAPSAATGRAISAQCAVCHGSNGISIAQNIPNLAGQKYQYLLDQLEAYKNGTRKDPTMNPLASSLSQEQIEDLAAYFASLPISVGTPSFMRKSMGSAHDPMGGAPKH